MNGAEGAVGVGLCHGVPAHPSPALGLDRPGEALGGPFAYLMGHGGQVTYLVPGADLVVVRFGDAPQLLHSTLYDIPGR